LQMKEPEDEAFDELAKRQGYWNMQGSRKHQIMQHIENKDRNDVIEEVASELETRFNESFGRDTVASFVVFIRGMKR